MFFINPYTFVSLPATPPPRSVEVPGHSRQGHDRFDGSFSVSVQAETPLLLGPIDDPEVRGDAGSGGPEQPPRERKGPPGQPRRVIIPGSSLMGAFRSVHETMNNSCLRIADIEYRAVHRLAMTSAVSRALVEGGRGGTGGLRLGVVAEAVASPGFDPAGPLRGWVPTAVRLVKDVIWVSATQFARPPSTGDMVSITARAVTTVVTKNTPNGPQRIQAGRKLYTGPDGSVSSSGERDWVVLVTDTHARPSKGRVWFACGLVDESIPALTVSSQAQKRFARAVEGSADLHGEKRPTELHIAVPDPAAPASLVGHRRHAAGTKRGTPVWVELNPMGSQVEDIRLSVAWRRTSTVSLGARIAGPAPAIVTVEPSLQRQPHGWEPCRESDRLCPSCRIFGSAGDDEKAEEGATSQNSYRGHVRVDDAVSLGMIGANGTPDGTDVVSSEITERAPLSSPRPTAGHFYLDNSAITCQPTEHPVSQWDSDADGEALGRPEGGRSRPRSIRGRKYYWRTSPALPSGAGEHTHRSKARSRSGDENGDGADLTAAVHLVMPKAVFRTRVTFENLTLAELGSLIAAICPKLALTPAPGKSIVTSVGGGKPLGWGSVSTSIDGFAVWSALTRYAGAPAHPITAKEAVAEYLSAAATWQWKDRTWAELGRALSLGAVPDQDVWYPVPQGTRRGTPDYDKAYAFFGATVGLWRRRPQGDLVEDKPLVSLPQVTESHTAQRLVPRGQA